MHLGRTISWKCRPHESESFRPYNKVQVLAHARSVRAVSWMHAVLLANNHVMDWGERVTDQTTKSGQVCEDRGQEEAL